MKPNYWLKLYVLLLTVLFCVNKSYGQVFRHLIRTQTPQENFNERYRIARANGEDVGIFVRDEFAFNLLSTPAVKLIHRYQSTNLSNRDEDRDTTMELSLNTKWAYGVTEATSIRLGTLGEQGDFSFLTALCATLRIGNNKRFLSSKKRVLKPIY